MTGSTGSDTIKATTLRIDSLLDVMSDTACSAACDGDHEPLLELIESARRLLWLAAAEHIPGIRWEDGRPQCTEAGWREIHSYQDGTPVKRRVELGIDGLGLADYFPRYDGPLDDYVALFATPKRHLHAVPPAPEDSPYLKLADMLRESGHRTLGEAHAAGLFSNGQDE